MRLIDADDLKKKENMDYVKISTWDEDKQEFVLGTIGYISPNSVDRAKTVDAVPVIRCKDCQYAEYTHDTKGRPCYDTIYCERNDLQAIANWFCADGRKKDGDRDE